MKSKTITNALVIACMLIVGAEAIGGAALSAGCTPAQQAELHAVESVVLADVAAGKTYEEITVDVGRVLDGQAGADVAEILDIAIQLLVDLGKIPPGVLAHAKKVQMKAHASRRMGSGMGDCRQTVPAVDGGM